MKILNLYAGIGGNRKLWTGNIEVTAVELDETIAGIYSKNFPNDKVIVADAHAYLLNHFTEFDFIWSSPPCPTHSVTNRFLNPQGVVRFPDLKLYEEIIFLKSWFKGKFVVENVVSYYEPLIRPQECGRHYFWANFKIPNREFNIQIGRMNGSEQAIFRSYKLKNLGFDLEGFGLSKSLKDKLLRNCVKPELGRFIFEQAFKGKQLVL